jgi:hypothetical protein
MVADLVLSGQHQIHNDGALSPLVGGPRHPRAMTLDAAARMTLARQHGVLSRAQALSWGLSREYVRYRLRPGGPWQRLLPGVYLTVTGEPTTYQLKVAALLYAGTLSAITGPAALAHYDIEGPASEFVDVLVPVSRQRANYDYVVLRRTSRMPWVLDDGAVSHAVPARAIADTARAMDRLPDVRALVAGAVQRRQCRIQNLAAELAEGPVRGSALLRTVLAEVTDGIRSAPEGDLRDLIIKARLPMPLFNASLFADGHFVARPDAWWPDHGVVGEVDSRRWHMRPEAWEETMARHARLGAAGLVVLHFSPRQLRTEPDRVVAEIAAALANGRSVAGITTRAA